MRLPDTVAETVGITHRRGLCPKQFAPLHRERGVKDEMRPLIVRRLNIQAQLLTCIG